MCACVSTYVQRGVLVGDVGDGVGEGAEVVDVGGVGVHGVGQGLRLRAHRLQFRENPTSRGQTVSENAV